MKKALTLLMILPCVAHAQVKFEKVYGGTGYDYGNAVIQTLDKGYLIAGATTSFGYGSTDLYLLKTDSLGTGKWHRMFGGINVDQAYAVCQLADSSYAVAGFTNSVGPAGYNMYLVRTYKNGDSIWTRTYGGTNWDFAYTVAATTDGGFILAGGTYSYGAGNEDFYIVKTDANGDTLWTKTYGGIADDEARKIRQTADGGYIITGFTKSFGDANGDIYAVRTNSNGDSLWTFRYAGWKDDYSSDVLEDQTGNFLIAGKTMRASENGLQGIRLSLTSAGALTGVDTLFGGSSDDFIEAVNLRSDGRLAVAGSTYTYGYGLGTSDFLFHIFNPYNGFHGPTFGGSKDETLHSLCATTDGGYVLCGNSLSYSILDHIYLVKTDSNGVSSGTVVNVITAIEESSNSHSYAIQLFPNPCDNSINLNLPYDPGTLSLFDLEGRVLYRSADKLSGPFVLQTSELAPGVYLTSFVTSTKVYTAKLIIQH